MNYEKEPGQKLAVTEREMEKTREHHVVYTTVHADWNCQSEPSAMIGQPRRATKPKVAKVPICQTTDSSFELLAAIVSDSRPRPGRLCACNYLIRTNCLTSPLHLISLRDIIAIVLRICIFSLRII